MSRADIFRYNSAFYPSLATNDYDITVVSRDFLTGGNASYDDSMIGYSDSNFRIPARTFQQEIARNDTTKFRRLDALSCIKAYGQVFLAEYRNLVIVSQNSSSSTSSTSSVLLRQDYFFASGVNPEVQRYEPFDW